MPALNISSLQSQVSAEEWALRCDLAACYRLVALGGWSDLVFARIDPRVVADPAQATKDHTDGIGAAIVWPAMLRKLGRAGRGDYAV